MREQQKSSEQIKKEIRELEELEKTSEGIAIAAKRDEAKEKAREIFGNATRAAFSEYQEAWRPLREKWEAFCKPLLLIQDKAVMEANNAYFKEISALRREKEELRGKGEGDAERSG